MFLFNLFISKALLQDNIKIETTKMAQIFWANPRCTKAQVHLAYSKLLCSVSKTGLSGSCLI